MNNMRSLLKKGFVYALSNAITKVVPIAIVPILTALLTQSEYGQLTFVGTIISLGFVLFSLNLYSGLLWAMNKEKDYKTSSISTVLSYYILASIILFCGSVVIYFMLGEPEYIFGISRALLLLILLIIFTQSIANLAMNTLRFSFKSKQYLIVTGLRVGVQLLSFYVLVVAYRLGITGYFLSMLVSLIITFLAASLLQRSFYSKISFDPKLFKTIFTYSLPLIPAGYALWGLNSVDVFIIKALLDNSQLAIYSVGYKFGMTVSMLVWAFQLAFLPALFSVYKKGKNEAFTFYRRSYRLILIGAFGFAYLISIFSPEAIHLLFSEKYWGAISIVPLVAFSYAFYALYTIFSTSILLKAKNKYSLLALTISLSLNIILNIVLIPMYGIVSAAVSTLVAYMLLALLEWWFAKRVMDVGYKLLKVIKVFGLLGIFIIFLLVYGQISWIWLLAKLLSIVVLVLLFWQLGILEQDEKEWLFAIYRKATGLILKK